MSLKSLTLLALSLALLSVPAFAGEVVHFTNGTTMEVESHTVEDGVVRVDLGGQAYMEFPSARIDKIETAEGMVAPLSRAGANRMVPTTEAAVVRGTVPSRLRRGTWEGVQTKEERGENVDVDKSGVAVYRPYGGDSTANKRQFGVSGRREVSQGRASSSAGVAGTRRVGARHVMPPKQGGAKKQQPIGLGPGSSAQRKKK